MALYADLDRLETGPLRAEMALYANLDRLETGPLRAEMALYAHLDRLKMVLLESGDSVERLPWSS